MTMSSSRPYLIRAIYDWIVDNGLTPHVLVNAMADGALVPQDYVKDGQITLNVAPSAVKNLSMEGNESMSFSARFRGIPCDVNIPYRAVLGIFARENGQGMMFAPEDDVPPPGDGSPVARGNTGNSGKPSGKGKPRLRVVK